MIPSLINAGVWLDPGKVGKKGFVLLVRLVGWLVATGAAGGLTPASLSQTNSPGCWGGGGGGGDGGGSGDGMSCDKRRHAHLCPDLTTTTTTITQQQPDIALIAHTLTLLIK